MWCGVKRRLILNTSLANSIYGHPATAHIIAWLQVVAIVCDNTIYIYIYMTLNRCEEWLYARNVLLAILRECVCIKIESLLLFPIFCQNVMNRKDPNFSDLTGAIQGSLEKKVLVLTLGMLQLCCLMKKICSGCFRSMYFID